MTTIQVEPGATVELRPDKPPQPPDHLADPQLVAGRPAPDAQALRDQLAAADRRIAELTAQLAAADTGPATDAIMVAPPALEKARISGDLQIVPDEATRQQIASSSAVHNDTHIVGSFRLCLDLAGEVSRVQIIKSTRFETYDQTILGGMRGWKYRPFLVDGKATPACAVYSFVYSPDQPATPAPRGPAASCTGVSVEDLVTQATNQYTNGDSASALALMQKALPASRIRGCTGLRACTRAPRATPRPPATSWPRSRPRTTRASPSAA